MLELQTLLRQHEEQLASKENDSSRLAILEAQLAEKESNTNINIQI